jgi:uncharacterized iron-regulated membrane protein
MTTDPLNEPLADEVAPPRSLRRALYWLHGVTGLGLGLLAVVVFFTGAIAVFAGELEAWAGRSRPVAALQGLERPGLNALITRLGAEVDPAQQEEVAIFQRPGRPLVLFFHTHGTDAGGKVIERGVRFDVDPIRQIVLQRREGTGDEVFAPNAIEALGRFFVDLHVQLLIPEPVGLYATGVVGFGLLVLLVTGVVVHRRFFREAFQVRWPARRRRLLRDLHTVTGVWLLPYGAVLAFTGAFFSFGDAVLLPALAKVAFAGNELALQEALLGEPPAAQGRRPARRADLDAILVDARRRAPEAEVGFLGLGHWGETGARVDVSLGEVGRRLAPVQLRYDGVTGAFLGEKPALGTAPSLGAAVFSWLGPLHYGNFGGPISRILWAFLGVGCCLLTVTGTLVWSERRRESWQAELRATPAGAPPPPPAIGVERMRRVLVGVTAGLPLSTFSAVLAWAVAVASGVDAMAAMSLAAGAALLLALAVMLRAQSPRRSLQILLFVAGVLALALPAVVGLATGASTLVAWRAGQPAPLLMDLALLALGGCILHAGRLLGRRATPPGRPAPLPVGDPLLTAGPGEAR